MPPRTRGLTTGAPSSGPLSRIPTETVARQRAHIWQHLGFTLIDNTTISAANWADNLVAFGNHTDCAAEIIEDWGKHLKQDWDLDLGGDSKQLVHAIHGPPPDDTLPQRQWVITPHMRAIGGYISHDAGWNHAWERPNPSVGRPSTQTWADTASNAPQLQ